MQLQCTVSTMDYSSVISTVLSDSTHDATLLTECSVTGDKTRRAHIVEDIICYS
jgi:hypothetical protein